MKSRWLILLAAMTLICGADAVEFRLTDRRETLQSPAVTEASGLAFSSRNERFLWTMNDSGGTPEVFLLGTDGSDRGAVRIGDARNIDWEDIASFELAGKPYLLVADTGDNDSKRDMVTLYIIREPKMPADGKKLGTTVTSEWRIDFRFEDGPRDCESVAVDVQAGKILLISKRTNPPEVYELPLKGPAKGDVTIARKLGPTSVKSGFGKLVPFADQPTGLDISADGKLAAVVTYVGVFLFPRVAGETWATAFAKPPLALASHGLHQAEAVAISKDGKSIYITSEGKTPPIKIYRR